MGTVLKVQPASTAALYCSAGGGARFDSRRLPKVLSLQGVRGAHLITAGRSPEAWCLYLEPDLPVTRSNADYLAELADQVSIVFELDGVELVRPVERRDAGLATDRDDWLTW